jgi:hypothetical protein
MKATSPRKAVELGHDDRASVFPPGGQRCGELRPPIEGVGPLPGLDLDVLDRNLETFRNG